MPSLISIRVKIPEFRRGHNTVHEPPRPQVARGTKRPRPGRVTSKSSASLCTIAFSISQEWCHFFIEFTGGFLRQLFLKRLYLEVNRWT